MIDSHKLELLLYKGKFFCSLAGIAGMTGNFYFLLAQPPAVPSADRLKRPDRMTGMTLESDTDEWLAS